MFHASAFCRLTHVRGTVRLISGRTHVPTLRHVLWGEMLMDAARDLNRPPWAAFHTVIEIHLLSEVCVKARRRDGERGR